ncbi:hypothetical protein Ancab_006621 [Ancistrocladus abbreviatus]
MAKGRLSLALHRPSYSPLTQPDGERISKVADKNGITISGNNISDGCIQNMNRVCLRKHKFSEAREVWEMGKILGAEWKEDEQELLNRINALEVRDRFGWAKLKKNQRESVNDLCLKGDKNTSFFHRCAENCRRFNNIECLLINGNKVEMVTELVGQTSSYEY